MANLIGKKVGKYEITELIGRGGMAEVYKGYHSRLDRNVAIKVLYSHLAEGEEFQKRFEREAKSIASLKHPNIVQVFDFDNQEDIFYMVTDYIQGGTLSDLMKSFAEKGTYIPTARVLQITRQLLSALDYAHKKGLLHRDVKPTNILIDEDKNTYLADFGIAKLLSGVSQMTVTGTLIGTPAYMSPEQGLGKKLTRESDLYSFGIILFQMLTGRVPFDAETPLAVIQAQINTKIPNPTDLRSDLTKDVEKVILKALQKKPENRYQNGQALINDLEPALAEMAKKTSSPEMPSQPTILLTDLNKDKEDIKNMVTVPIQKPAPVLTETKSENKKETVSRENKQGSSAEAIAPSKINKPVIYIASAIIIILIAWFAFFKNMVNSPAGNCSDPFECAQLAEGSRSSGEPYDAIYWYDQAIKASGVDRSMAAGFWCDKADLYMDLGDLNEARQNFQTCLESAESDPELEELRMRAEDGLTRIPD